MIPRKTTVIAAIIGFLYAIVSPFAATAESTHESPANPWGMVGNIGGCGGNYACQPLQTAFLNFIQTNGTYFSSPGEALSVAAAFHDGPTATVQYVGIDYLTERPGYVISVTLDGGSIGGYFGPACPNCGYISFEVDYLGNNYGTVCGDYSYVEGDQTCPCECTTTNKALGDPCDIPGQCEVGNPISLGIGNKYEAICDYTTAGINPLSFTRYYNSLGNTNTRAYTLGMKWRSTYDRYLRFTLTSNVVTSVVAERADGQELVFTWIDGVWTTDLDVDAKFGQSGGIWSLTNIDDSVESYGTTGLLDSIQARDGYTQTLQYDSSNRVTLVTDSFGRTLQFTYPTDVFLQNVSGLLETVTTSDGLVMTYAYNSSGENPGVSDRLASVNYSTTPQTGQSYVYENASVPFGLTGIIDEDGNRFATWTYDSTGRATSSQHAGGADLTTVVYNSDGSRNVTNALGQAMVYEFTTMQGVPKVTEIDRLASPSVPGAVMKFTYDYDGYLSQSTDWNTNVTSFANDVHGQPLVINEAQGTPQARTTTDTYATNFHLPVSIVAPRKTIGFTYDTNGNPLTRTETDTSTGTMPYSTSGRTRTWTNTFDNFGHVLTATGPRTDVIATTTFTYDASNNLSTVTDPLQHVTRLTNYTGSGLPLTMIDPNGVVTTFTYDIRNRLLTRTVQAASGNATTTFGYDAVGQVTNITLPDNSFLNYQYDAAHRLQSVSNSFGESINYLLDALGDITNQTIRSGNASIVKTQSGVFDSLGRMLQQIGAASQTTTYGYDGDGNRIFITDGLTHATSQAFDPLNRLVSVIDPLHNTTAYGFDAQDNLTSVTDPRTLVTSYVYDGFKRVIQESSPDKGTTVYLLDNAGNRTNKTDARSVVTQRTFDKLNRVTAEIFPASPGENITFTYDATNGGNFGIGRLTGYSDETGNTTLVYNERGDVVSTTRTIGGQAYTTAYAYDLADHVLGITYPSGDVIGYTRDSQGRVSSVSYTPNGGALISLATSVTYMPFGPLSGFAYGNGLTRSQSYDQDYRLTNIAVSAVQNLSFVYDPVNDIKTIADNLAAGNNQAFGYDADYRLTAAAGNYGAVSYMYDGDGNRLTRTAAVVTENYNYLSTANRLQSTVKSGVMRSFGYTADGNLSSDNRGTPTNLLFGYGNRNRYNALTKGGTLIASYKYNALGERLIKTVGGTATHYHYDQKHHLIAESQSNGTLIREYVWLDDMPLAQIEASGTIYYIHPDQLNAPQKMTDASQAIVWDRQQQPFGESLSNFYLTLLSLHTNGQFQMAIGGPATSTYIVQTSTNLSSSNWTSLATNAGPFTFVASNSNNDKARFYRVLYFQNANSVGVTQNLRFPGQYYDAESGLNYNMMRDYDPTLGRYMEGDPIGLRGGINPYGYAGANPLRSIDLSGLVTLSFYPPGSPISRSESLNNPPNFYSVGAHGNSQLIYDPFGNPIDPLTLAGIIGDDPDYQQGEPVMLHACNTGSGDNSFAQQLANLLNVPVIAPDNIYWSHYDYNPNDPNQTPIHIWSTVGPTKADNSGHMITFVPQSLPSIY